MKGRLIALAGVGVFSLASIALAGDALTPAEGWEKLWFKVLVDLTVIGAIFLVAAIYMMYKYRSKGADDIGKAPKLSKMQAVGWALVPAFLFMADDFFMAAKGWSLWNTYRNVPENALEIKVTGSMWQWQFEYENGVMTSFAPPTDPEDTVDISKPETVKTLPADEQGLIIPVGRPIVLRMTSDDVVHSFSMAKYRVKEDVMPGRVTYLWFMPDQEQFSAVTCAEFCGTQHSIMYAPVQAVSQEKYDAWMKKLTDEDA